ncbi:MAG TPA: hypothetical protein DEQ14_08295 [Treponema sp.]|nr:hypothetical protein [Treponema sp.]
MKRYCVKCRTDRFEYIEIIKEIEDGYLIRLTRVNDGYTDTTEQTITRHLFDICLKTGYIYEAQEKNESAA